MEKGITLLFLPASLNIMAPIMLVVIMAWKKSTIKLPSSTCDDKYDYLVSIELSIISQPYPSCELHQQGWAILLPNHR